ncbi:MAG: acyl-CoA dehydrogenase family protein [Oligoflexia bacterium]|nr:acyl-CoA dehydrogenase family protein [Oligoflexia bacterium]
MHKSIQTAPTFDLQYIKNFTREMIIPGSQERDRNAHFAHNIYAELHKLNIMHAVVPKTLGGLEMPVSDMIWVIKELAFGSAGVATTVMANLLGYSPVVLYGSEELKRKRFLETPEKSSLWSFAMTEAAVGFDVGNTQTRAKKIKTGYILNGRKDYITNSAHATHISVFANVQNTQGNLLGISTFYVPANAEGVRRGESMNKLGHRESNTGELFFENVFVPDEHLLGEIGQGIKILHHSLGRTKTLIGAIANGICTRAFELATGHLASRGTQGHTLLNKSAVQQFLVRYYTEIQAAWLLTCHAAATWDSGSLAIQEASMTKMYSSDLAVRFASEALELMGAQGYSADNEISRLYRDAKLLEIYEGSTQVLEILIGKEIFKNNERLKIPKIANVA